MQSLDKGCVPMISKTNYSDNQCNVNNMIRHIRLYNAKVRQRKRQSSGTRTNNLNTILLIVCCFVDVEWSDSCNLLLVQANLMKHRTREADYDNPSSESNKGYQGRHNAHRMQRKGKNKQRRCALLCFNIVRSIFVE